MFLCSVKQIKHFLFSQGSLGCIHSCLVIFYLLGSCFAIWTTWANNLAITCAKLCRNFSYSSQIHRKMQLDKTELPKRNRRHSKRLGNKTEKSLLSSCAYKNAQTDSNNSMREIQDLLQDPWWWEAPSHYFTLLLSLLQKNPFSVNKSYIHITVPRNLF